MEIAKEFNLVRNNIKWDGIFSRRFGYFLQCQSRSLKFNNYRMLRIEDSYEDFESRNN